MSSNPHGKDEVQKPRHAHFGTSWRRHNAARGHDRQGEPREGGGRRRAGLRVHRQPAAAAARHRRSGRCAGGEDAARPYGVP